MTRSPSVLDRRRRPRPRLRPRRIHRGAAGHRRASTRETCLRCGRSPAATRAAQVHILTPPGHPQDLPAAAVVYRMTSRWREENYFRYARAHFALDALDSYAVTSDNPARLVPNPAKKTAAAAVSTAKRHLAAAEAARQCQALHAAPARPRHHRRDHQRDAREAGRPGRRGPPQARNRPGCRESHARENPARRAQPRHGAAGRRDQAHHPRHPDGRLQRRDHPRPRPRRTTPGQATRHTPSSAKPSPPAATSSPAAAP